MPKAKTIGSKATMVKAKKATSKVASKAIKKENRITPKAEKDMALMKKSMEVLKKETPADWPADAVPNLRAFAPLPEGWHHAMKVTGKSGRGDGGRLRHCYIGPGGLVKWHKYDLERHLGVKIEDVSENRPRCLSPLVLHEFPAEAVLKRTNQRADAKYIEKRCDGLAGWTVADALLKYQYECNGEMWDYNVSDLRYDLKVGRLALDRASGACSSQPAPAKAPKASATAADRRDRRPAPSSSKSSAAAAGQRRPRPVPAPEPASASGAQPAASAAVEPSRAVLRKIRDNVFKPMLQRAASGMNDEVDLFTLLGVGRHFQMDGLMMDVLPDVLRKPPAERGDFGQCALKQFEMQLNKLLSA